MIRIDPRMFARGSSALVASALLALGAGCAEEPAYVEGATVTSGTAPDDSDVVYVQDAPVVDIETYPSVVYEGEPVYYVGGQWYRRGPRGWGYYRQEPAELGRQRASHDSDPRWTAAHEAPRAQPSQAAPTARPEEVARPEEQAARPAQVAPEARPQVPPPQRERTAAPAPKEEAQPRQAAPKRGRPPVKRPQVEPERR